MLKILTLNYKCLPIYVITSAIDRKYELLRPVKNEKIKIVRRTPILLAGDMWTETHKIIFLFYGTSVCILSKNLETSFYKYNFYIFICRVNLLKTAIVSKYNIPSIAF